MVVAHPYDLTGRGALVTGASSGLGAHFARTLATAGAHVVLAARRIDRLEALRTEIVASGGRADCVELDVTKPDSVSAAVQAAQSATPIDVLVNNAGVAVTRRFVETSEQDWARLLDTNVVGVAMVAREVARAMIDTGRGGSVINIGSILGVRTGPGASAYAATKAAVGHLTRGMAIELARHGIRVNAILPGFFVSELVEEHDEAWHEALTRRIPQRRIGRLEDLDGALLLLASDASAYITGSSLVVDGGHSINML